MHAMQNQENYLHTCLYIRLNRINDFLFQDVIAWISFDLYYSPAHVNIPRNIEDMGCINQMLKIVKDL